METGSQKKGIDSEEKGRAAGGKGASQGKKPAQDGVSQGKKSTKAGTAQEKKSAQGGATRGGKSAKTDAAQGNAAPQGDGFALEVALWVVVAASILLFISNLGIGGVVGNAVSRFFFGVFGLIAYVFPIVLIFGVFFAVSNRGNRIAAVKTVAIVIFVAFLCMFMEMVFHGEEGATPMEAFAYSHEHKTGGGIIGGALVSLIYPGFGAIGAFVIDAVMLIISLVLITERSALRGMQKGGQRFYEKAKAGGERRAEHARERREEREAAREKEREEREEREAARSREREEREAARSREREEREEARIREQEEREDALDRERERLREERARSRRERELREEERVRAEREDAREGARRRMDIKADGVDMDALVIQEATGERSDELSEISVPALDVSSAREEQVMLGSGAAVGADAPDTAWNRAFSQTVITGLRPAEPNSVLFSSERQRHPRGDFATASWRAQPPSKGEMEFRYTDLRFAKEQEEQKKAREIGQEDAADGGLGAYRGSEGGKSAALQDGEITGAADAAPEWHLKAESAGAMDSEFAWARGETPYPQREIAADGADVPDGAEVSVHQVSPTWAKLDDFSDEDLGAVSSPWGDDALQSLEALHMRMESDAGSRSIAAERDDGGAAARAEVVMEVLAGAAPKTAESGAASRGEIEADDSIINEKCQDELSESDAPRGISRGVEPAPQSESESFVSVQREPETEYAPQRESETFSSVQGASEPAPQREQRAAASSQWQGDAEPAPQRVPETEDAAPRGALARTAAPAPAAAVRHQPRQGAEEIARGMEQVAEEIGEQKPSEKPYVFPPVELLKKGPTQRGETREHLEETARKLQQTLKNFGVNVTITEISCGPAVTRYELQPEMGVKVSKIVNLADDIKLNLAATDIRIEAPIPGKPAVGIEVPNKETVTVTFRELVESEEFKSQASPISFAVGRDIAGKVTVADIAKMPHLLIAGATGSGKSVCINTIIMSILYKADPKDVRLIMVDPKVVELSVYNGIPHLLIPVVTDPKKASDALHWAVAEMDERYQKFAAAGVRDLKGYNAKIDSIPDIEGGDPKPERLPQIVIIVDELADLMMVAPGEVEDAICRLAQLARACGIHLIIATQRPSVNVITGLIKANMPSRIAFAVTSGVDSRTILDMVGAEKLLGKGDMLFNPQGVPKPIRVQGAFVSDQEVSDVVSFLRENNSSGGYSAEIQEKMESIGSSSSSQVAAMDGGADDGRDAYFADAARLLMDKEKASIGMLQRYFKIGFNRAARIMDQLEEAGVVGAEEGTKPRRILMTPEQFEEYEEEYL